MGGFSSALASPAFTSGMTGLSTGMETGSGIANAMYNAASMRMQARAIENRSGLQAALVQEQYYEDYKQLQAQQKRQQSMNRVDQMKHGITGASATAVMMSYAGKAQQNLEKLYYNAAMKTGSQSLAAMDQRAAVLERARQYDWQATQKAIAGVVKFGTGTLLDYTKQISNTTKEDPLAGLDKGEADIITQRLDEMRTERQEQWARSDDPVSQALRDFKEQQLIISLHDE